MNTLPLKTLNRFEEAAKAVALAGPGCGGSNGHTFRLGAIIVSEAQIISSGFNSYKTHPRLIKYTDWPYQHAEQSAIFCCRWKDLQRPFLKLYVARIHKDLTLAIAKPCAVCQAIIRETSIKEVYYSTNDGKFLSL